MPKRLLPRDYLAFLWAHRRLLAFGLLTAMLSGFGQTFYIGLFNPQLRDSFNLGHGELGLVYGGATLASALLLTWLGKLYDRSDLRLFLSGAALLLITGCLLLGASNGLVALLLALFLLRLGGQGLMTHIALTTMAQRFHGGRGKAVSIAAMGLPLAEAVFPATAVAALAYLHWRELWLLGSVVVLVLFLPLLLWLLKGAHGGELPAETREQHYSRDWSRHEVVRDWRFLLLVPAAVAAPFTVTIAFFHQIPLAEAKGWTTELVASGLALFAVGHVVGLLGAGPLVDRLTATRLFVPSLLPLIAAMAVLAGFDATWAALLWPALLGLGLGFNSSALTPLLAERYGLAHLGAIRALLQAIMILSTAIGPPLLGGLLDRGLNTDVLAGGIGTAILIATVLAAVALYTDRQIR
ncbi:MAG: MFS transporter [Thiohalophilus sp.]|uniref:MFS transporter n=1 Tax=Thiohalophilus sp. TaxID=3028392 RepID=UPI002870B2F3|nr:MFS transporter [Thiohalophilus sp.]MDR9437404.1 MFS transporter [Thiohalophilus sp.]